MALDPSIALSIKPAQIESPLNALGQMLQIQGAQNQNRLADMTIRQHQQEAENVNALNAAYSGAMGSDGKLDQAKLLQALAQGNQGAKIPAIQKQFSDAAESKTKADKVLVELQDSKLKQSRAMLDNVQTPEQYLAWHQANHTDPVLGPMLQARGVTVDSARQQIEQALAKPGGLQELITQSKLGAEKFIELNKPTIHTQNTGDATSLVSVPGLGGAPTVVSRAAINQSADSKASTAVQWAKFGEDKRHNAVTEAHSAATLAQGNDKPLNDSQSKSYLFGNRMLEADKLIASLADNGVTRGGNINAAASSLPWVGGAFDSATNWTQSPEQQQVLQAKRDFMTAALRRESGASIAPSEFETFDKTYFPQIGDTREAIANKVALRKRAIEGTLIEVPANKRPQAANQTAPNTSRSVQAIKPGQTLKFDAQGNMIP